MDCNSKGISEVLLNTFSYRSPLLQSDWKKSSIHIKTKTKWRPFSRRQFKRIFFDENVWISIKNSLKFVPKYPINNIPTLVLTIASLRSGDKPLSEPMMVCLLMHICVTFNGLTSGTHAELQTVYIFLVTWISMLCIDDKNWQIALGFTASTTWFIGDRITEIYDSTHSDIILTRLPWTKWPLFRRRYLRMH